MIFAVIGEELGLIGAAGVIAAFAAFCWAGLRIAVGCPDRFGSLLATGLTVLVGAQAATNLAAVLGLAPVTGITLPFLSYGGSSLIVALAGAGILLNIAHADVRAKRAQVPDRSGRNRRPRAAVARSGGRAESTRRARDVRRVARSRRSAAGPEAGYELDTFEISGFPREASMELLRSLALAGKAPAACRKILERRRPDVVLGGGGYVAGPMVFAAATRRIPAVLMEADAHLGLANRLALPFARRVFLAFPIPGREGEKYRVTGRPVPASSRATPRDEGRRRFDLPADGPLLLVYGGSQGARTLNELVVDAFADEGPLVLHLAGERDFKLLRDRVRREGYRLLPWTHDFGAALPLRTSPWLARAVGVRAGCGWHAGRARPVPPRDGRSSDEEGAALREGRRRHGRSRARCGTGAGSVGSLLAHSARLDGWPPKCGGWPGRTRPRRSQTTCSRLPVLSGESCGSRASAARG